MDKESTNDRYTSWPNPTTLTLKPKAYASTTTDAVGTSVACESCRKLQPTSDQMFAANAMVTDEVCVWEVWDRGQAAFPLAGDTLLDTDSVSWIVKTVRKAIFENLYICVCVKAL